MTPTTTPYERTHPLDILRFAAEAQTIGRGVALVFVTDVIGGAVRMPGLRMAVRADGVTLGYVSNGCVEGDIIGNALAALADGKSRALAYGAGTPAVDLRLPCGGRMELIIIPQFALEVVRAAIRALVMRRPVMATLTGDGHLGIAADPAEASDALWRLLMIPKIRVRIVGVGAEAITLARLAMAADMEVLVQSPDEATVTAVAHFGGEARLLSGLSTAGDGARADDAWSACAVLFHDHEWEARLLPPMLASDAFYVGALGSYRTHQSRRAALQAAGVAMAHLDRLHAPIGLIPQLRDAPLLAISVLAEITQCFQRTHGSF